MSFVEELPSPDRPHDQIQFPNDDLTFQSDEIFRPFPTLAEEDIFKKVSNDLFH